MGSVTNIILVTGVDDGRTRDQEHPNVDKLNTWLREVQMFDGDALVRVDQYAKGGKAMESDVFLAAVNYLDRDGLLSALQNVPWERPHNVQLLLRGEDDELFVSHHIDHLGKIVRG